MRILCVVSLLLFLSCKNSSEERHINNAPKDTSSDLYTTFSKLYWLEGKWTNITSESQSYENWIKVNDSTLKGYSYTLVDTDTVFAETIVLTERNKEINFVVKTANQNDAVPVQFSLVSEENEPHTFENRTHDFPNQIVYSNPKPDSLHAWILGKVDGEAKRIDFYYRRKK